ncbi:MAG: hypothetical protein IPG81_08130 [Sandaracinaceae bacterium]|nr:hypothetical protein [Sandaracinaceae bacterium]
MVTPLGGTCALVGGQLLYTAGGTMGADSCWVRICETCGASPVCSVTEVRYQVRCAEDDTRTSVCGVMGNGTQPQRCVGGEWVDDGVCDDPDVDEVTASDDGVRALEAVDPLVTGAGGSFPVAGLLANDSFAAAATFALQGGGTTSCNGQVGLQAGNVVYTGPANLAPVSTCRTSDSFTYQVCAAAPAVGCDTATVTITINRRPSVASTLSCAPVNTANLSLGVQSVFSDPDGDGLDASSIVATGPGGSISRSGDVITWSPNNASNAGTYAQSLTACDDNALPGCAQGCVERGVERPSGADELPDAVRRDSAAAGAGARGGLGDPRQHGSGDGRRARRPSRERGGGRHHERGLLGVVGGDVAGRHVRASGRPAAVQRGREPRHGLLLGAHLRDLRRVAGVQRHPGPVPGPVRGGRHADEGVRGAGQRHAAAALRGRCVGGRRRVRRPGRGRGDRERRRGPRAGGCRSARHRGRGFVPRGGSSGERQLRGGGDVRAAGVGARRRATGRWGSKQATWSTPAQRTWRPSPRAGRRIASPTRCALRLPRWAATRRPSPSRSIGARAWPAR